MMKLKLRFIGFFTLGLILFLFYMTFTMIFSIEIIMPLMGMQDNPAAFTIFFLLSFLSGGIFFSIWFVRPIMAMMTRISELTLGNYKNLEANNSRKKSYWLYREVLADLDTLSEKLQQTENERLKLEQAKQDWVRGISHDIKTPLTYIVGYSSLLLASDSDWTDEQQQSFLSQIEQKGKYIENLVNNLNLSFRLEDQTNPLPLQIKSFDLISFMEKLMADMLNAEPEQKYTLSFESLDTHLVIDADEGLLYRAIANLVGNAMHHNPSGTHIQTKVKRDGTNVIISVCDNGIGMSPEVMDTLFMKYHDKQTSSKGKFDYAGGLGLSIVKSIIEAHLGTIAVSSIEGEKTEFTICLPVRSI